MEQIQAKLDYAIITNQREKMLKATNDLNIQILQNSIKLPFRTKTLLKKQLQIIKPMQLTNQHSVGQQNIQRIHSQKSSNKSRMKSLKLSLAFRPIFLNLHIKKKHHKAQSFSQQPNFTTTSKTKFNKWRSKPTNCISLNTSYQEKRKSVELKSKNSAKSELKDLQQIITVKKSQFSINSSQIQQNQRKLSLSKSKYSCLEQNSIQKLKIRMPKILSPWALSPRQDSELQI